MRKEIRTAAVALVALCAAGTASAAPDKTSKIVEVNGKKYRVVTQGRAVLVANKAFFVAYDVNERDDQRAAVKLATGCGITDELPSNDAKLRGKLDCPSK